MKPIAIGSDHAGFALKEKLRPWLQDQGLRVKDFGTYSKSSCDYPDFVRPVAEGVSRGNFKRGILICKSGIGSSIAANKFPGVRAALTYNVRAAELSRRHNDSNILVLGSAFVKWAEAKNIFKVWFKAKFEGAVRHRRRLNKIKNIEKELLA